MPQTEPIEEEKLLTVRTIDVTFVGEYREEASDQMSSYVCFSFNGEKPVTLAPTIFYADQFRNEILEKVKGADSEGEKEADQRDFFVQKLNAFYSEKNISDPMLTEEGLRELIHVFPETLNGAIVVYDPYVTKREDQTIYGILISMGIIRNVSYTEADIRAAVSANHALLGARLTFHS